MNAGKRKGEFENLLGDYEVGAKARGEASPSIGNSRRDSALAIKLLFSSLVEAARRVHEKFHSSGTLNAGTDGRVIIPAADLNIVLNADQQLRHGRRPQISGHPEMPDLIATEISNFSGAISPVPICGY